jgi:hypothetical protein
MGRLGPFRRREVAGIEHARELGRSVRLTGATEGSHGEDPPRPLVIESRKRGRHQARPELITRAAVGASEWIERRRERRRALRGLEERGRGFDRERTAKPCDFAESVSRSFGGVAPPPKPGP